MHLNWGWEPAAGEAWVLLGVGPLFLAVLLQLGAEQGHHQHPDLPQLAPRAPLPLPPPPPSPTAPCRRARWWSNDQVLVSLKIKNVLLFPKILHQAPRLRSAITPAGDPPLSPSPSAGTPSLLTGCWGEDRNKCIRIFIIWLHPQYPRHNCFGKLIDAHNFHPSCAARAIKSI